MPKSARLGLAKPQWKGLLRVCHPKLLCLHYSPSMKATTIPMNMPFAEADLSSHILWTCPYMWQDQFNLQEKGGTPVDMCSLLLSFKAIKRVWSQERSKKSNTSCDKKALYSKKNGTKWPGTDNSARVPKKAHAKNTATFARSMRARTQRTILEIVVSSRKTERKNPISAPLRKAERNPIPQSSLSRSWARKWTGMMQAWVTHFVTPITLP